MQAATVKAEFQGKPISMLGVVQDITDQVKTEANQQQLNNFCDQCPGARCLRNVGSTDTIYARLADTIRSLLPNTAGFFISLFVRSGKKAYRAAMALQESPRINRNPASVLHLDKPGEPQFKASATASDGLDRQ